MILCGSSISRTFVGAAMDDVPPGGSRWFALDLLPEIWCILHSARYKLMRCNLSIHHEKRAANSYRID